MTVCGIFVYTELSDTTAGLGTGEEVDGNGFETELLRLEDGIAISKYKGE